LLLHCRLRWQQNHRSKLHLRGRSGDREPLRLMLLLQNLLGHLPHTPEQ
jgi:hypothetical protein